MGEQVPCPVCTLYLHQGMNLADHLETHPKEQVIKALVSLATNPLSLSPPSLQLPEVQQCLSPPPPLPPPPATNPSAIIVNRPPAIITKSAAGSHQLDAQEIQREDNILNGGSHVDYLTASAQNLMIVNRQSTTVYQSMDKEYPDMGVSLPISSGPLQMFSLPPQSKFKNLPPPPEYGTAVSHLRSQQLQQNISQPLQIYKMPPNTVDEDYEFRLEPLSPSSRPNISRSPIVNRFVERPLPTPSAPSVLRYADTPVMAHVVEKDNGDFIYQETPKHVVECVEDDNGEFSVIEKVVRSPPAVVQFNEDEMDSSYPCNDEEDQLEEKLDESSSELEYIGTYENEDVMSTEDNIAETEEQLESIVENENEYREQIITPKNGAFGVTVISNIKLDPNESYDLMENLIASQNSGNTIEWTNVVDPSLVGANRKAKIEHEEYIIKSEIIDIDETFIEPELEETTESHSDETIVGGDKQHTPSTSAATSVIRMVKIEHKEIDEEPKLEEQEPEPKTDSEPEPVTAKPIIKKSLTPVKRPPYRKAPKKLVVKPKKSQQTVNHDKPENDPGPSNSQEAINASIEDSKETPTLPDQTIEKTQIQEVIKKEIAFEPGVENVEPKKITQKRKRSLQLEIESTALQPMIVHEPSLSAEPNFDEQTPSSSCSATDPPAPATQLQGCSTIEERHSDLTSLLKDCWRNDNLSNSGVAHLPPSTVTSSSVSAADIDKTSSLHSSFTEFCSSASVSNSGGVGDIDSRPNESTFTSFPSTSSFSKPSTSSFALREQTDYNNPSNYTDYPFSLLYSNEEQPWLLRGTSVFQQNQNQMQSFQELDFEKSSYIDLDSCKRTNVFNTDTAPLPDTLNIRTDEKMPAKGEISEQESNGEIENLWSPALFQEPVCRLANNFEGYMTRESWSLSNDDVLSAQDLSARLDHATTIIKKQEEPDEPSDQPTITNSTLCKKIRSRVKKVFQCPHCSKSFPMLKARNSHMIDEHDYKRINRRLIRQTQQMPTATITSETAVTEIVATVDVKPPVATKPELGVISTVDTTLYPRTKYDSIRAGVYRMLMNFNLSVLQQKKNVEIDKSLYESKSFCCYTCKRDFISVKLFDEHLSGHPAECFTCGRTFTRWTYFSLHLKRHLGWKDFACKMCDKKFVIRSAMIEHMRKHTGNCPLKCNMCDKTFKRYSNLTQHKRCHLSIRRKKEYVCYCGEVLPSKARFLWHKEIHDTKPKCCPYCRDRFVHSNSLKRHIRLSHSDRYSYEHPVECPICNQVYSKASLKAHMSTHSMDTQHECNICNKSFSTKWNLKIHNWVHANRAAKPFKCEMCTKAFVREIDYKNHINSHKHIRPFTCEFCGCKFIRKHNYMRHRREHHEKKKFSCDLCGKLFHRHYYLIEHRRTHTGERPFLCTICGKSSTTKTNHNKHLKIHHSRDPFTSEA